MAKEIKFTDEELATLAEIQSQYQQVQLELGGLKMQQIGHDRNAERLMDLEDQLMQKLNDLNAKENDTAKELNEKYGPGSLDPASGVFTPAPEAQAAPEEADKA
tara:strand:+ start:247 stop:558 length:312 start_codon:yes stop_codon:yes gene_type:complete